jgi:HEAT repeat protein
LEDEDSSVCWQAAETLGKLGDARAVEPLIAALKEDSGVGEETVEALGRLGDARAVEPLIAALGDEDWDTCAWAAEALRRIGTPEALAAFEEWAGR